MCALAVSETLHKVRYNNIARDLRVFTEKPVIIDTLSKEHTSIMGKFSILG